MLLRGTNLNFIFIHSLNKLIFNFVEKDLWHVIDIIFQYLSYDDLKTAKSVSREWKEVITTEEYWKKRLKKKVSG